MPKSSNAPTTNRKRRKHKPRHIPLPDGDELWPRRELATQVVGITERTASNHKWPTVYVSNVAYCPHNKVLALMASRVRHAPEPRDAKRRRQ